MELFNFSLVFTAEVFLNEMRSDFELSSTEAKVLLVSSYSKIALYESPSVLPVT